MNYIPTVIEKNYDGEKAYDIYSRLLEERIIMLTGEINDNLSTLIIAQLLFLDAKDSTKDIQMYINSPGGSITSGLAIYDTMNYIKSDVSCIVVGMAASMAAFLLSAGTRGKRYALENSEIMIHQPLGGASGQVTDIEIAAKRLTNTKRRMSELLANHTGKTIKQILRDCERDNFMTSDEALAYGLIDRIVTKSSEIK